MKTSAGIAQMNRSAWHEALIGLGRFLREARYRFTTITPASHERVNARPGNERGTDLREAFGWSRPFPPEILPSSLRDGLLRENILSWDAPGMLRSDVRFSSWVDHLYAHSAFPTTRPDAVFFGPDTYRFLSLLKRLEPRAARAVDVGCGSGAGGISIARHCKEVVLADLSARALDFGRVNADLNDTPNISFVESNVLDAVDGPIDLVISNPPYLIDEEKRTYRDGGGRFGEALSVRIVRESIERLEPGGRLILYTASAIVGGIDTLYERLRDVINPSKMTHTYEEIDPDVFGEELDRETYRKADRIAVVALDLSLRPTR